MSSKKITTVNSFGKRLKDFIDNKICVSQKVMADNIGISSSYLSMFLNGKRGPSAELIAGLFINYSESLYWLLTGKNENNTNFSDTNKNVLLNAVSKILNNDNTKSINKLRDCIDEIQDYEYLINENNILKGDSDFHKKGNVA